MSRLYPLLRSCALLPLLIMGVTLCRLGHASELQVGSRYEILRPLSLMATYNSGTDRRISRDTAKAFLHSKRYANRYFVAFQVEVPAGTVMTVIRPESKVWNLPLRVSRYFVQLEPDPSHGLEIEMTLDRGLQGSLDGLNPELFRRLK